MSFALHLTHDEKDPVFPPSGSSSESDEGHGDEDEDMQDVQRAEMMASYIARRTSVDSFERAREYALGLNSKMETTRPMKKKRNLVAPWRLGKSGGRKTKREKAREVRVFKWKRSVLKEDLCQFSPEEEFFLRWGVYEKDLQDDDDDEDEEDAEEEEPAKMDGRKVSSSSSDEDLTRRSKRERGEGELLAEHQDVSMDTHSNSSHESGKVTSRIAEKMNGIGACVVSTLHSVQMEGERRRLNEKQRRRAAKKFLREEREKKERKKREKEEKERQERERLEHEKKEKEEREREERERQEKEAKRERRARRRRRRNRRSNASPDTPLSPGSPGLVKGKDAEIAINRYGDAKEEGSLTAVAKAQMEEVTNDSNGGYETPPKVDRNSANDDDGSGDEGRKVADNGGGNGDENEDVEGEEEGDGDADVGSDGRNEKNDVHMKGEGSVHNDSVELAEESLRGKREGDNEDDDVAAGEEDDVVIVSDDIMKELSKLRHESVDLFSNRRSMVSPSSSVSSFHNPHQIGYVFAVLCMNKSPFNLPESITARS